MGQSSPSSGHVRRVKSTVSTVGLWCVPVDPCIVHGHETTQKLLRIALKQRQTVTKRGTHRADSFLMPKISCRI